MITVGQITVCLDRAYPPERKEAWDRVGLNCGREDAPVTKVLVALDPFAEACREASAWGAELLVTHHALLWEQGFVTSRTEQGRNALFLIENGIACYNAHTNLDVAADGVNDALACALGLAEIQVIRPSGTDELGRPCGLLRMGTVPEQPLSAFLPHCRQALHCPGLRYVDGGKPVCRVAVGGGACASELAAAAQAGCDTFVTADIKYNDFWDARAMGVSLIDAGHFYTENPVCERLAQTIRRAFPELEVRVSQEQKDCMRFYV